MTVKLSLARLGDLPDSVRRPTYSRDDLSAGILHIGVGNFHRAHQAVYLDKLFGAGLDHDWALIGAGIKPFDAARRDALQDQDWLTTVVELSPGSMQAGVTGAMIDFLPIDGAAIAARIAQPDIRIVSMTITEGGYFIDEVTGGFDAGHPDIVHDAANPDAPRTVFGVLLAGLLRRRDAGLPPPAILSCDNLPENGDVTRQALTGLAGLISDDLRDWVSTQISFPNSMVDRITPATTDEQRAMLAREFGIDDAAPVMCEPYLQWVIEDDFPLGRPRLEQVGVQFVDDVARYETMKLRILNAGHAAIAYPSALLGFECVHEAMADPDIRDWLSTLMQRDVIPVLAPIEGADYGAYLASCIQRFANPAVRDTIARLCHDGSNRQPKFVIPTISEALAGGTSIDGLALEIAFWCRYCAETPDLSDPRADTLRRAALASRDDPGAFLGLTDVFGGLDTQPRFKAAFADQLNRLLHSSPREALQSYLASTSA